jgi:uncharacterized protein YbaR (Trm112 family)
VKTLEDRAPLRFTRMTPLTPRGFFLQWSVTPTRASGDYVFSVFRAGAPNGPWTRLAGPLANQYAFVDDLRTAADVTGDPYRSPTQFSLGRRFFYRVTCTTPAGQALEVVDDTDPDLDPLHAQQWRRANFDFNLSVRRQGIPIVVLKRRRWGVRCAKCTDPKTGEIVRAGCVESWGTAIVGGYWDPVLVWGQRSPAQQTTTVSPEQRSDSAVYEVKLPHAPLVERGDMLVCPRDNLRLEVDQQSQTEIGTVTVHQTVRAIEVNHDHLIYRFKVETQNLKPLV